MFFLDHLLQSTEYLHPKGLSALVVVSPNCRTVEALAFSETGVPQTLMSMHVRTSVRMSLYSNYIRIHTLISYTVYNIIINYMHTYPHQ